MKLKSTTAVVVGAGICGIVAAILLRKHHRHVVIVEKSNDVGGLLSNVSDSAGYYYDQGTHVPETTGVSEIDSILFDELDLVNWHQLEHLSTGNYFAGSWDYDTQTIDARKLPSDLYHQGIGELLANYFESSANDIETYLKETLGETFFQYLSTPIIKKLYGSDVELSNLTRQTGINYFGAGRVKVLSPELTSHLKNDPILDTRLGFHSAIEYEKLLESQGISLPKYFYPKSKLGVKYWVEKLVAKAVSLGIEIITDCEITTITHSDGKIEQVTLSNQQVLGVDTVFWSAPPIFALKAANIALARQAPPTLRTAVICHFKLNKPLLNKQNHYIWNWDPSSPIFRVTLYDNLANKQTHQLSAELLTSAEDAQSYSLEAAFEDLKSMGLVSHDTIVESSYRQVIHNTFPVPTFEFAKNTQTQYQALINAFKNIIVSGRFSGRCWLQSEVLKMAYDDINSMGN